MYIKIWVMRAMHRKMVSCILWYVVDSSIVGCQELVILANITKLADIYWSEYPALAQTEHQMSLARNCRYCLFCTVLTRPIYTEYVTFGIGIGI